MNAESVLKRDYSLLARHEMVRGQMNCCGVLDQLLLERFENVSRETFLPTSMHAYAYADMDLRLPNGSVMLAPMLLALLIQLAQVDSKERVLSLSCPYARAILEGMAQSVNAGPPYDVILLTNGMLIDPLLKDGGPTPMSLLKIEEQLAYPGGRFVFFGGRSPTCGQAYVLTRWEASVSSLMHHFDGCALPSPSL